MTMQAMIDEWYPVGLASELDQTGRATALMGEPIEVVCDENGDAKVTGSNGRSVRAPARRGHCYRLP